MKSLTVFLPVSAKQAKQCRWAWDSQCKETTSMNGRMRMKYEELVASYNNPSFLPDTLLASISHFLGRPASRSFFSTRILNKERESDGYCSSLIMYFEPMIGCTKIYSNK